MTFSAQPDENASEVQEAQIVAIQLVKPLEDATTMLDLADRALNKVALPAKMLIIYAQFLVVERGEIPEIAPLVMTSCMGPVMPQNVNTA